MTRSRFLFISLSDCGKSQPYWKRIGNDGSRDLLVMLFLIDSQNKKAVSNLILHVVKLGRTKLNKLLTKNNVRIEQVSQKNAYINLHVDSLLG
jgi:hypothetical protein